MGRDPAKRCVLTLTVLRRWFPWLQLGWLILLAPFLLFITVDRWWCLLGIPIIWLASWLIRGFPVRTTPLSISVGIVAGMTVVSMLITPDMTLTLPKAAGLFLGLAFLYAVVDLCHLPRGIALGVSGLVLIGIGVSVVGLLGMQWLEKVGQLASITAGLPHLILGIPGASEGFHPNEVAGTLLWIIPLALTMSFALFKKPSSQKRWGLLTGLAALWMLSVLLLSQSRSGWFGMAVACSAMIAFVNRPARWIMAVLVLAGILLAVMIGPDQIGSKVFGAPAGDTIFTSTQEKIGALDWRFRLEIWQTAVEGVSDFPFTGMGLGTFRKVGRLLYPLALPPSYDFAHAHNEFLQAGLDLGLFGLAAYLAIYVGTYWMLWKVWHSAPRLETRYLALGLAGGLIAHAVYGLTDAIALGAKPGIIFWILLGLTCGLFLQNHEHNNPAP